MKLYGPTRNLWDGGALGEGILKDIKAHINCVHSNFSCNCNKNIMQIKALNQLIKQINEKENISFCEDGKDDNDASDDIGKQRMGFLY